MNDRKRPRTDDGSSNLARLWTLDPAVAHLNHGSYGATPRPVQQARRAWLRRIEVSPERFFRHEMHVRLEAVRGAVACFLGIDEASLALVGNVTEAVGVALGVVPVEPGSNIVISTDCYPWVARAVEKRARAAAAEVRTAVLPAFGPAFDEEVLAAFLDAVDERTALVVVDQITSPTALRLPVEALIDGLAGRVPVLVDAAHSPGVEPEPVISGADFWVASLHKWSYAPRGTSVLVAAESWRDRVEPLVVSDGTQGPFPANFDYIGTRDYSAILAIPAALEFPDRSLGLTWPALTAANVASLRRGAQRAEVRLGAIACGPVERPMATLELPVAADPRSAEDIGTVLLEHGVEVVTSSRSGRLRVRISAQPYVGPGDFERLCDVMLEQVIRG